MASIKWNEVIPEAVEQAKGYRDEFGEAPTLRGVYYRLVSVEAIPNTKSAYKGLSRVLTKARLEGEFPWNLMQDNVRESTGQRREVSVSTAKERAEESVEDALGRIKGAFDAIEDPSVSYSASKWAHQPKRVVVAIEKDAILGAVKNVLRGRDVEIFPLRGYTSTTFMKQIAGSVKRLNRYADEPVELVIITDYDPSGEDMVRDLEARLRNDYGCKLNAEKVLVTKEQIRDYDLPAIPDDAEEVAKLRRDPRFKNFADGVYRVELDAMAAIEPDAFRTIVREAVDKHFDKDIYEENKAETDEANQDAEETLRRLYKTLEDSIGQVRAIISEIEEES